MKTPGFSSIDIDHDWQQLIKLGPRFLGTPNEIAARDFILNRLADSSARIRVQEFTYQGWSLIEKPQLLVNSPSSYKFPCEAMINCRSTPQDGIMGIVQYIGKHIVMDAFEWEKYAVLDKNENVLAYISGVPGGPAHPQPLAQTSAPLPHFVIGAYELSLLTSWIERGLEVNVKGTLKCETLPNSVTKNVIASFNPESATRRMCLCAHYDSVYNSPGANDNAGAVSALLAIARRMTEENSDIPLDLLFLSGEEWDLIGSKAYVAELVAKQQVQAIKMLINLDSIAEGSSLELWAGPESFEEQIRKATMNYPDHPPGRKILCRFPPPYSSDHTPFFKAGIPACMIFCGETVKYHIPKDDYCPEGVINIRYITDLTWHLFNTFAGQDTIWKTWKSDRKN
jgi:hypothetical protein